MKLAVHRWVQIWLIAAFLIGLLIGRATADDLPAEYQLTQQTTITVRYRVVNLAALEKRADYLLYDRSKVPAAERRAMLRPKGALDIARCVEIIVGDQLIHAHDSLEIDDGSIPLQHTDTP